MFHSLYGGFGFTLLIPSCRVVKSFETCIQNHSKGCPYLMKKFMEEIQKQDVASEAFDKCGIRIASKAGTVQGLHKMFAF